MKENEFLNENNNNKFTKLENYDFSKNNNNNINQNNQILDNKEKEKDKDNIIIKKQKNLFLNNNINKYNHVSRIINLKSLNGQNNKMGDLKESIFNKYSKMGVNQNLKQIKDPYKKEQKRISAFDSILSNNNNEEINKL